MYTSDGTRIRTAQRPNIPKKTQSAPPTPHIFETYLQHPLTRKILKRLTTGPNGHTPMENIFYSYRNPNASWNADKLASLGVRYVEVSLDSADPAIHDDFRQMKGAWARSIEGIKNVVATPGMRCGIATCFTKDTVKHAEQMIDLAISLHVNPCVYMPSQKLGDLRKSTFAEIWNQPLEAILSDRDDRGDHCGVCDYRAFCGGCRARAESYTGDVQAGDPGCVYNEHMWNDIMSRRKQQTHILSEITARKVGVGGRGEVQPMIPHRNGGHLPTGASGSNLGR